MNWEERLKKWANAMEESAGKVTDWGSVEVPEYIRELIRWEIVSGVMMAAACLIGLIAVWTAYRVAWVKTRPSLGVDDEVTFMVRAMGGFAVLLISIPVGIGFSQGANQAVKAYVAPRVVIVDKIAALAGVKTAPK